MQRVSRFILLVLSFIIYGAFGLAASNNYDFTDNSEARKVLVTGGAGFLGSHLCDRLIQRGDIVFCIDDLSTGHLENIKHLLHLANFHFIQHDISKPLNLEIPFEEIYNLACPASPPCYQKDPVQTLKTNVLGALFVLELARKYNSKIFQASTSEIYGDPLIHPQKEDYWGHVNSIGLRSCYDEGKRAAETLFFDYHRQFGIKIKLARIFNTYGPKMSENDGRVVSNFIVQALRNQPLTIYGIGNQTRSFCYVDDLIDAILAFMAAPDEFIGPVNLGNANECTILEIAQEILALTGSPSTLIFEPIPSDDPRKRCPDLTLAQAHLNWAAQIPLREGLSKTIVYFKDFLQSSH